MSLRQQQVAVFCGTVVIIFGLLGAGIWLIAQRLTTEATLQTALLMARQVEPLSPIGYGAFHRQSAPARSKQQFGSSDLARVSARRAERPAGTTCVTPSANTKSKG
jgi:hypothetical protein